MRKFALAVLILALGVSVADARRHHRHYRFHMMHGAPVMMMMPDDLSAPRRRDDFRRDRERIDSPAQFIPRDWQLQPADPKWQGRRYVSPDGNAWLAFYAVNAANDNAARFKAIAFLDGEEITYIHGDRDRLTVSGTKGDRIFYRKIALACDGTLWRHVALEYPAQEKREFDAVVERISRGFDQVAGSACGDNLFTAPQPASQTTPAEPAKKPEAEPAKPQ